MKLDGMLHYIYIPKDPNNEWKDQIPWSALTAEWVAMDSNGEWWGFMNEPVIDKENELWDKPGEPSCLLGCVKMPDPPSWEESKVKKPKK